MQKAYINALYEIMQTDKRVASLLSDSGTDYDVMMAREMPEQCFNFGIAEQNKVGIAAGMAMLGKIPFVYTSGAFLAYRSYEFIRNDVCYQNQNVKIVGMGSGTAWRTLGPSHHTTEDIAALRAIPNLTVLSPSTPNATAACVRAAYKHQGPVYLRMGMSGETEYYDADLSIEPGKSLVLDRGSDVAIFSTGSILCEVMDASRILKSEGISCSVIDICSIKPIDEEQILQSAKAHRLLVSVEEHSIYGGLGGAVSEVIAENGLACPLMRIGLDNCFAKGYGTQFEVREKNCLDSAGIAKQILAKARQRDELL